MIQITGPAGVTLLMSDDPLANITMISAATSLTPFSGSLERRRAMNMPRPLDSPIPILGNFGSILKL